MRKDKITLIKEHAKRFGKKIIFADVDDPRLYKALRIILSEGICRPALVGDEKVILKNLKKHRLEGYGIPFFQPLSYKHKESFAKEYFRIREKKGMTIEKAREAMDHPAFFSAMLVRKGLADGMVCGLKSETKPFIPAFQILGMVKGCKRVSGMFILEFGDKTIYFADCAVNINPDTEQLAETAVLTGQNVRLLEDKPRIAMLSFSTHGSARHELVDKVAEATKIAKGMIKKKGLGFPIDGEIQFDAAFIPEVAKLKCRPDTLKGRANVFIFPDLNSGNIAYKIAERLGGAKAIGPILQGLKKPANDLSRGASPEDIANVSAITCFQASKKIKC